MKKFINNFFLFCGLLLTLAALPVFAQENKIVEDSFNKKPLPVEDKINKKPLQDFSKIVREKIANKQINLSAPFSIEVEGVLNQNGELDTKLSRYTKLSGDEQIVEVAKNGIEAVSDSGMLIYLRQLGFENVRLLVSQDEKQFSFSIKSSLQSENRARTVVSGWNIMASMGKTTVKDEETLLILNNTKIDNAGKDASLIFAMPVEDFQAVIQRNLSKVK